MTMQKIQNTHLEVDFSVVMFEIIFLHKSRLYWPKTRKPLSFSPSTCTIEYIFCFICNRHNPIILWVGINSGDIQCHNFHFSITSN